MLRLTLALVVACMLSLTAVTAVTGQANPSQAAPPKAASATPLDLNSATIAQLEALPGIGPKLAERILQYRQKNGRFNKVEDLMNVPGIGEKNFLRLKPLITVTPVQKVERPGGGS